MRRLILFLQIFLLLADKTMPLQKLIHHSKNKRFDSIDILFVSSRHSGNLSLRDTQQSFSWDHKPNQPLQPGG